jgi:hypothetical protein
MFAQDSSLKAPIFAFTGDWKPPSNLLSTAIGLAISACTAIRWAIDSQQSEDFSRLFAAGSLAVAAANHFVSVLWR